MPADQPILALENAKAVESPDGVDAPRITLRVMPGDLALIEARNTAAASWFADLCSGLAPLSVGNVAFLGRNWE